jgi:hypothetical protein
MNKREYAKANLDWLAAKAEEEGVVALPEGIYYKEYLAVRHLYSK